MRPHHSRVESCATEKVDEPNPPRPRFLEGFEEVSFIEAMFFNNYTSFDTCPGDLILALGEKEAFVGS